MNIKALTDWPTTYEGGKKGIRNDKQKVTES